MQLLQPINRVLERKILAKWDSGKIMIVTGPRQVGKTTLIRTICQSKGDYLFINGDDAESLALLKDAGEVKLRQVIGNYKIVFIDEAQRIANIGILLKIIYDQIKDVRVIVSGSSVLNLYDKLNEPLTGRKWELSLHPFCWSELKDYYGYLENKKQLNSYLVYGMYPEVINESHHKPDVLKELISSYLYKDILHHKGIRRPELLDKILFAIAAQVGSEVNYNELAGLVRADRSTVEDYISLLEKNFVLFRLNPFSRNIRNEISTSRKIYFYDNGVRNTILGDFRPMELRQDTGALWENFLVSERIKTLDYSDWYGRYYFWRTYQQQEIDWIEEANSAFMAYEFKWNPARKGKAFPKTFMNNYNISKSEVITPDNMDEFLNF